MLYLLDTNVVSELRKPRPHGAVVAWLQSTAEADLYLSAVTLGEIQAGIELTREQDATKASEIEAWADLVAASYSVLPMDGETLASGVRWFADWSSGPRRYPHRGDTPLASHRPIEECVRGRACERLLCRLKRDVLIQPVLR
jgi:predicted nucleic acid-binding protein